MRSRCARKGGRRAKAKAKAKAKMVLRILESRGIPVGDAVRERVRACPDLDRLEAWARRAMHATDAAELFAAE